MEIDFGQNMKSLDKKTVLEEGPEGKKEPMTLRYVSIMSLMYIDQQHKIGGPEKMKRYSLALKIQDTKDPVKVDAANIVLLKEVIGDIYGPLVVGQAYKMLEQEGDKPPEGK